jgi:putative membrane protein
MTRPVAFGLPARACATALAAALVAALAGCAAADKAAVQVQAVAQAQTSPSLSVADATFLDEATRAGIADVALGQLARTQGTRASTRDFALRLTDSQTSINQELTRLGAAKQIRPTESVDPTHQDAYQQLAALHGRAFDRAWLDQQASDQQAMLHLYRAAMANGADPDVRAFAARTIPLLEHRFALVERLGGRAPAPPPSPV